MIEVDCGDDCEECSYRLTLSGCAGQPNATQCTRKVAYAIRPIGHRVPTYRCLQCYCQPVIDRNAAWGERYRMFRLLRDLRVERAGGWRSYVMGGRAASAWKRLAKKLSTSLDAAHRRAEYAEGSQSEWRRRANAAEQRVQMFEAHFYSCQDCNDCLLESGHAVAGDDYSSNHKEPK